MFFNYTIVLIWEIQIIVSNTAKSSRTEGEESNIKSKIKYNFHGTFKALTYRISVTFV